MPEERDSITSLRDLISRLREIPNLPTTGMNISDIIDEAVIKAEKKIAAIVNQVSKISRDYAVKLFSDQLETLKSLGVPDIILDILLLKKNRIIDQSCNMNYVAGNFPFIPVIPQTYLSILSQMAMISNNGKKGYTHVRPVTLTDVVEIPEDPYYIYDVEAGKATMGLTPQESEMLINRQGRLGTTVTEVIALCIHTDTLSSQCIDAVGSRFKLHFSGYYAVPSLQLFLSYPKIYHHLFDQSISQFGAASCGSRGN